MRRLVSSLVLCSVVSATLGAASYPPLAFRELVARADMIFVGDVDDVRPVRVNTREGPIVVTRVLFRVIDPIVASSSRFETLEFFGGQMDGITVGIYGMPRFAIGDRHVVFARREHSINPVVGFTQGLLRVRPDHSRVSRVFTFDGTPVPSPSTRVQPDELRRLETLSMAELRTAIVRTRAATRR
jgi:hypothetical protein